MTATSHREAFPAAFQRVVDLIGPELSLRLAERFGGRKVYVPEHPTDDCLLAQVVGLDAARRIAEIWARDQLAVPFCTALLRMRRDAEICDRYEAGESGQRLAAEYRISERHVYTILARRRQVI